MPDLPAQAAFETTAGELAALRQQVAELREAVRARDDFIAIAAHELRNAMTPIMGTTELALHAAYTTNVCSPRLLSLLQRAEVLAQNFIQRSARLLDFGRFDSGNPRLDPSPTDLSALVLSVAQSYEATAAHGRSQRDLDVPAGITAVIDRVAVKQVVENLLSNALKFGAGQPVTVRLRSDKLLAHLDVQDQGMGMSPDQQARIFGRLEQVMAQHRGSGFGIGLWISNRLVAAMGGRITVSSRLGEGSTFTVTLPLAPPEPDRMPHESA